MNATKKVFWFKWPTYDILMGDLKRAGIEHKDSLGRVVHFHAFRKTWQTWGVRYGINQRAAQEILGHSDPALTANAYTDVPSLSLDSEMVKIPWIRSEDTKEETGAQIGAQKSDSACPVVSLADIKALLEQITQATGTEGKRHFMTSTVTTCHESEMAARKRPRSIHRPNRGAGISGGKGKSRAECLLSLPASSGIATTGGAA